MHEICNECITYVISSKIHKKLIIRKSSLHKLFDDSNSSIRNLPVNVYWKNIEGIYIGCNDRQAHVVNLEKGTDVIELTDYDLSWQASSRCFNSK